MCVAQPLHVNKKKTVCLSLPTPTRVERDGATGRTMSRLFQGDTTRQKDSVFNSSSCNVLFPCETFFSPSRLIALKKFAGGRPPPPPPPPKPPGAAVAGEFTLLSITLLPPTLPFGHSGPRVVWSVQPIFNQVFYTGATGGEFIAASL